MGKQKKEYICSCYKITKDDLKGWVKEGYTSFKELSKDTKLGKSCSSCKTKNKKRFKKFKEKLSA